MHLGNDVLHMKRVVGSVFLKKTVFAATLGTIPDAISGGNIDHLGRRILIEH